MIGRFAAAESSQARIMGSGLLLYGLGLYGLSVPSLFTTPGSLKRPTYTQEGPENSQNRHGFTQKSSPLAAPWDDLLPQTIELTERGEWVLLVISLSFMGASSAAILVPALPYMNS
eukprot:CAMPEP_0179474224 /NCGR_PEP_ID=MMETSP0799-20121207/53740_1 /TAXON_ID=46947 /ORGANISM="Geminigera cryophila, Strain CCMP2564" /LENGTH=115 /DNA_ID=CAMNT_0021283193 /DNA_START=27 /DNA_END=371 /DNA_ORIENTATION=+